MELYILRFVFAALVVALFVVLEFEAMKEATGTMIILCEFIFIFVFIISFALIPTSTKAEDEVPVTETQDVWVLCQPDSYVCIRSRASKHGIEEGRLYAGDLVKIDSSTSGKWVHSPSLSCESGKGWINAGYLSVYEPVIYDNGAEYKTNTKQVISRYCIFGKVRNRLKKGTVVTVYLMSDDWSVTSMGYIQTRYLEPVCESL